MWTRTTKRVLSRVGLVLALGCLFAVRCESRQTGERRVDPPAKEPVADATDEAGNDEPIRRAVLIPLLEPSPEPSAKRPTVMIDAPPTIPSVIPKPMPSVLPPFEGPGPAPVLPPASPAPTVEANPKNLPPPEAREQAPVTAAPPSPPSPPPVTAAPPTFGPQPTELPARLPGPTPVPAEQPKPQPPPDRLKVPPDLPGARVAPLDLPSPDPAKRKEREEAIRREFPELSPLDSDIVPLAGPNGSPLTLSEMQQLALSNSPHIREAAAQVEVTRGIAVQAGLWPNPVVGFQGDQINAGNTAGYLGVFIAQTIRTAGKPELARAAALIDVLSAELNLRRTRAELMARVRAGYFAVLTAREEMTVLKALAEFTDEVYRVQVELLKAGQTPAYESLQLRVLSSQARAGLAQARNRYVSAWHQLANYVGIPGMPPTNLAGEADMPAPQYEFRAVLDYVLRTHTDVGVALNDVQRAQIELKWARVMPIPDVNVVAVVQKDNTVPPFNTTANLQVGVPVPVWDRNQGAIKAADASLMRADQEADRVRHDLTTRVTAAFERYDNSRRVLAYYQTGILPDQMRAYRALYLRHHREPDKVSLQDVVNAQQILAQSVTTYIATLNTLWTAVVDLASLMQTDDLFAMPTCQDPGAKEPRTK